MFETDRKIYCSQVRCGNSLGNSGIVDHVASALFQTC